MHISETEYKRMLRFMSAPNRKTITLKLKKDGLPNFKPKLNKRQQRDVSKQTGDLIKLRFTKFQLQNYLKRIKGGNPAMVASNVANSGTNMLDSLVGIIEKGVKGVRYEQRRKKGAKLIGEHLRPDLEEVNKLGLKFMKDGKIDDSERSKLRKKLLNISDKAFVMEGQLEDELSGTGVGLKKKTKKAKMDRNKALTFKETINPARKMIPLTPSIQADVPPLMGSFSTDALNGYAEKLYPSDKHSGRGLFLPGSGTTVGRTAPSGRGLSLPGAPMYRARGVKSKKLLGTDKVGTASKTLGNIQNDQGTSYGYLMRASGLSDITALPAETRKNKTLRYVGPGSIRY